MGLGLTGDEGIVDDGTRKRQGSFQQFNGIGQQTEMSTRVCSGGAQQWEGSVMSEGGAWPVAEHDLKWIWGFRAG